MADCLILFNFREL